MEQRTSRSGAAGFTLVEVLTAILILGLVITTSLGVFLLRTRRLQQANQTILAYQALQNEAEIRRRIAFAELDDAEPTFLSDVALLAPLQPVTTKVSVASESATIKHVTMRVIWRGGQEVAKLSLIRVDTGGSNLW